jgi:hypothetical protein
VSSHHSLFVTQRHTVTTYNVASCLARVADAEWLRYCEGVRRFGPAVGKLGEWKALCEGGWTGPVPPDLPGMDMPPAMTTPTTTLPTVDEEKAIESANETYRKRPETDSPLLKAPVQFPSTDDASDHSRGSEDNRKTTMASLDHFPSPPTHFPIPPFDPTSIPTPQTSEEQPLQLIPPRKPSIRRASSNESNSASPSQPSPSTTSEARVNLNEPKPLTESPTSSHQQLPQPTPKQPEPATGEDFGVQHQHPSSAREAEDEEFGVQRTRPPPNKAQPLDKSPPTNRVERSGSIGSVVAAMRTRYAQNVRFVIIRYQVLITCLAHSSIPNARDPTHSSKRNEHRKPIPSHRFP